MNTIHELRPGQRRFYHERRRAVTRTLIGFERRTGIPALPRRPVINQQLFVEQDMFNDRVQEAMAGGKSFTQALKLAGEQRDNPTAA